MAGIAVIACRSRTQCTGPGGLCLDLPMSDSDSRVGVSGSGPVGEAGASGAGDSGSTLVEGLSLGGDAGFDQGGFNAPRYCDGKNAALVPVDLLVSNRFIASGYYDDSGTEMTVLSSAAPWSWPTLPQRAPGALGDEFRIEWKPSVRDFVGLEWQYPANNWTGPGLCIEDGASKVQFQARGEVGGELVMFGAQGTSLPEVELTTTWATYELPLDGVAYNQDVLPGGVRNAFSIKLTHPGMGHQVIQVDDIRWVGVPGPKCALPLDLAPPSCVDSSAAAQSSANPRPRDAPAAALDCAPPTKGPLPGPDDPLPGTGGLPGTDGPLPGIGGLPATDGPVRAPGKDGPPPPLPPAGSGGSDGSDGKGGFGGVIVFPPGGGSGGSGSGGMDTPARLLLDDFEDGDAFSLPGLIGVADWQLFNDGSVRGDQYPAPCVAPRRERGRTADSQWSMHTYGCGFNLWGAGLALVFDRSGPSCPLYDYTGIEFAINAPRRFTVTVEVSTLDSVPIEQGGTCTEQCGKLQPPLRFDLPVLQGWQVLRTGRFPFNPSNIVSIAWFARQDGPSMSSTFDFTLDDVALYRENIGFPPPVQP